MVPGPDQRQDPDALGQGEDERSDGHTQALSDGAETIRVTREACPGTRPKWLG